MKKICFAFALICAFLKMFADDGDKLRLAVMEFEDRSGTLSKQVLEDATEYLRGALISANKYTVIATERQNQTMIKEMKKESYKECNDKNCQIRLGQALSADTILRTTITRLGQTFVIASELIDLEKEATVVGAREKYDGTEESLSIALDNIAEKVITAYESIQNEGKSKSEETSNKENGYSKGSSDQNNYQTPGQNNKMSVAEAQENLESGRRLKKAGLAMLGIGTGLTTLGIILMVSATMSGDDDEDALIASGITMLSIGPVVFTTGVIMAPIGAVREKRAKVYLNSLSVVPTKSGAYASVGFSF